MYNETKVWVACYMSASNNEKTSVSRGKGKAKNAMGRKNKHFLFNERDVMFGNGI